MSTFRTLIESLVKNIYVEGLSLEESCLVTLYEDAIAKYEDAITKQFMDYYSAVSGSGQKPQIVKFTEDLDAAIDGMIIEDKDKHKYKVSIAPRPSKPTDNDQGISIYAYAIIYINIASSLKKILGIDFNKPMPIEIVYRSSDHSKIKDSRVTKLGKKDTSNDDVDVFVPGAKYERLPYVRNPGGNPLLFNFWNAKGGYDYREEYIGTAKQMIGPALIARRDKCIAITNSFLAQAIKDIKSNPSQQYFDSHFIKSMSRGEQKHSSNTPLFDEWLSDLETAIVSHTGIIYDHLIQASKPSQDKSTSFQQATDTTKKLDKMAQTQQDHDDMTAADPSKKR